MTFDKLADKYKARLAALIHPGRGMKPVTTERDLIHLVGDAAEILHRTGQQQQMANHLDTATDHLTDAHASRGHHRTRALRNAERALQQALKDIQ
ncbi:hypothetical protein [Streptomyces sp. NPDC126503]|uniref:hypothetical protein n=1 Tax=Streptomyces sp. NPDC126503 TaxID=3155315 RepID=UPI003320D231